MSAVKYFEIRDRGTFIPVIAIKPDPQSEAERWLLGRSGFGLTSLEQRSYVLVGRMDGGDGHLDCDPYGWGGGARTMPTAHQYIIDHWDSLESGAVVCVEFIAGERDEPKPSERRS